MDRFDGYNRHDFHHPRTTREAFGSGFHIEKEPNRVKEVLLWLAYVLCVGFALLFLQG
jgi:TRAP-type C4-dicarboxylate transport system permease small subunit